MGDSSKLVGTNSEDQASVFDRLEKLIEFPAQYPLKIMGVRSDGFAQEITECVRAHIPDFDPATIEMRASSKGTYLSVDHDPSPEVPRRTGSGLQGSKCTPTGEGRVVILRSLRTWEYLPCLEAMRQFTQARSPATDDELWLVEHPPVFTQGLAGLAEHVLAPGSIPVVATERGGQVTYHGPGQVLAYLLLDLKRNGLTVRSLVTTMEAAVIDTLAGYGLHAIRKNGAPGVYMAVSASGSAASVAGQTEPPVAGPKISALGIKVTRGCTYHGLALNVAMDLEPFSRINPCGFAGLEVTDVRTELLRRGGPSALPALSGEGFVATAASRLALQLEQHLTQPR